MVEAARRTDIHGELEEGRASRALKGISLNFDVLITRVITSSAERRTGRTSVAQPLKATCWQCRPNKSGSRLIHAASYRGWNWQLCSCIPCTDIDRLRSRALFQSRKFPNRVCPSLRHDYERSSPSSYGYGHVRHPRSWIYQFPRYRCLPLPRIIDISRRSSRNRLRYEIFHRMGEHYHFTSFFLSFFLVVNNNYVFETSRKKNDKGRRRYRAW